MEPNIITTSLHATTSNKCVDGFLDTVSRVGPSSLSPLLPFRQSITQIDKDT
jgi:hypothetical protein